MDGAQSHEVHVDSGVPQGTVLGPLLFLLPINDLPQNVNSKVRLFADDCLLYHEIHNEQDQLTLQNDLTSLERWGHKWGMRFNVTKCNIMRISQSRTPLTKSYTISGHILHEVSNAKYLGVNITSDLSWSNHVNATAKKANSALAET